ncbi:MAG: hypothetical protein ACE365_06185 [Gammaproteobacteria bacterium]
MTPRKNKKSVEDGLVSVMNPLYSVNYPTQTQELPDSEKNGKPLGNIFLPSILNQRGSALRSLKSALPSPKSAPKESPFDEQERAFLDSVEPMLKQLRDLISGFQNQENERLEHMLLSNETASQSKIILTDLCDGLLKELKQKNLKVVFESKDKVEKDSLEELQTSLVSKIQNVIDNEQIKTHRNPLWCGLVSLLQQMRRVFRGILGNESNISESSETLFAPTRRQQNLHKMKEEIAEKVNEASKKQPGV